MPATVSGPLDATSDVLSLVRMRGEVVCVNGYSAPWSFSFQKPVTHFHIVERGSASIAVDGAPPMRVDAGDLAILPLGTGHVRGSDPGLRPMPIDQAIEESKVRLGSVHRLGGGGDQTHVICGQFSFAGVLAPKLLTILPSVLHIAARPGRPLEWLPVRVDRLWRRSFSRQSRN